MALEAERGGSLFLLAAGDVLPDAHFASAKCPPPQTPLSSGVRPPMALPTSKNFVEQAEAKLCVSLPTWLRSRLLAKNGGTIETANDEWELFSVFDTTDRKSIARSSTNIPGETESARRWPGFPPSAVAIASNGTGDLLVLFPAAADPTSLGPTVYHWRHATGEPPRPVEASYA